MRLTADMLDVENLTQHFGAAVYPSPLLNQLKPENFVRDFTDRVIADVNLTSLTQAFDTFDGKISLAPLSFEIAGPREKIFFKGSQTKVAIVTCGGLAPGLNNVVQSIVSVLIKRYLVNTIFGVPFGFQGFTHDTESKRFQFGWRRLDVASVQNIESEAGSILGTSRGNSDPAMIVDALVLRDISILFTLGGDGTLAGADAIHTEIKKRNLPIAVIGIPKTIDNDVLFVSKTFGFETAVTKAVEAIRCAQTEARSAFHGIGLVKLMGRGSGSLTATAAAAMSDADLVLVPEVPITLDGDKGILNYLVHRVLEKGYATVIVAEGAGQDILQHALQDSKNEFDASGNIKLKDIGRYLQHRIQEEFKSNGIELTLKYIDPSYMQRAQCTTADDAVFCSHLGQQAVHAAMAGKTGIMIGYAHETFTHVPLKAVSLGKKQLDIKGALWMSVLANTGQPSSWH
jgi:6-phosphofructokinase 1